MLFPYAVDVPYDRRPFMNWLLVSSVIVAYCFEIMAIDSHGIEALDAFLLEGWGLQGLVGHLWLHGDIVHLLGNMWFLWIFGNAVCAKVGNLKYFPVYLVLGLFAGIAHLVFDGAPALGASGAINGVVGMFLIFFWENEVSCLFGISVYFRRVSISSFWVIGLWLIYDIWGAVSGEGMVAYYAHLGGFLAGVLAAIVLLKMNWVTMYHDEQSLVELFEEWWQGRQDAKLQQAARDAIDQSGQVEAGCRGAGIPVRGSAAVDTVRDNESPVRPRQVAVKPQKQTTPQATAIRFVCDCGQLFKVSIRHAGKKGTCPKCKQVVRIPVSSAKTELS